YVFLNCSNCSHTYCTWHCCPLIVYEASGTKCKSITPRIHDWYCCRSDCRRRGEERSDCNEGFGHLFGCCIAYYIRIVHCLVRSIIVVGGVWGAKSDR